YRYRSTCASVAEKIIVADVGLAFMQFRFKYGRDAKTLDELVPEFLTEVPKGIFHPEPVRMKIDLEGVKYFIADRTAVHNPGTIRIYTGGENGKDEGGHESQRGEGGDDWTFCVPPATRE